MYLKVRADVCVCVCVYVGLVVLRVVTVVTVAEVIVTSSNCPRLRAQVCGLAVVGWGVRLY